MGWARGRVHSLSDRAVSRRGQRRPAKSRQTLDRLFRINAGRGRPATEECCWCWLRSGPARSQGVGWLGAVGASFLGCRNALLRRPAVAEDGWKSGSAACGVGVQAGGCVLLCIFWKVRKGGSPPPRSPLLGVSLINKADGKQLTEEFQAEGFIGGTGFNYVAHWTTALT